MINNKSYIGWAVVKPNQDQNEAMERRWKVHCVMSRNPKFAFHRAIAKYGIYLWQHEIIVSSTNKSNVKSLERDFIKLFKTCTVDSPNYGYNMTRGGDGGGLLGRIFTNEHCKNISNALRGKKLSDEHRKKLSESKRGNKHPGYGKHRSDVTKQKLRIKKAGANGHGAKLTDDLKLVIIQLWNNRNNSYVTQYQLAKQFGVTQSTISRLLNGKTWCLPTWKPQS